MNQQSAVIRARCEESLKRQVQDFCRWTGLAEADVVRLALQKFLLQAPREFEPFNPAAIGMIPAFDPANSSERQALAAAESAADAELLQARPELRPTRATDATSATAAAPGARKSPPSAAARRPTKRPPSAPTPAPK